MSLVDALDLIQEEMKERGWSRGRMAIEMSDYAEWRLTLDLLFDLPNQAGMILGEETATAVAKAFKLPDHKFLLRLAGELPNQGAEGSGE
jgi:hypothetical protein